jgi:S1-C subfamily serine protease
MPVPSGSIARHNESIRVKYQENYMSSLQELSHSFADIVATAGAAIVAIDTGRRVSPSGIHWRKGLVITSDESLQSHDELSIVTAAGTMPVTLLGRDPSTDLAVFSLADADSLPVAAVGDTATLKVGHLVWGLARSPEGDVRATMGALSILGGSWQSMSGGTIDLYLRPDVTLYRGFAGGALVDATGRVVGMNTMGRRGTALTIPAETIDRVVTQLVAKGRIARGYLGVGMQPVRLSPQLSAALNLTIPTGVILINVEPQSPADRGGLVLGDILISWDGTPLLDPSDVRAMLNRGDRVGQQVQIGIIRGGALLELSIEIGER